MIRLTTESDLTDLYALHAIDSVNQYLPYTTWTSQKDAHDWYERVKLRRSEKQAQQYSIDLNTADSQVFVGTCIVFGFDAQRASAEFGYVLHPDFWGKGLMHEAMLAFTNDLQERLKLKTLKASVESPNLSSLALLKKLGFMHDHTTIEGDDELQHWLRRY